MGDEKLIWGLIGGGIAVYLISRFMQQPATTTTVAQAPSQAPTTTMVTYPTYIPPTPTPTPTPEPTGPSMQESMHVAEAVVMGSSPFPSDDCHDLRNTGAGQLRIPYGYWFTFEYTCNKIGMLPMVATYSAYVTVVNGAVTGVDITRTHPP